MAKIPTRLEDLLPLAAFEKVIEVLQRPELSGKVREALSKVGLKEMNPLDQVQDAWQQARSWLGSFSDSLTGDAGTENSTIINATGFLFQTDVDRAPMISSVGLSQAKAASAFLDRSACLRRSAQAIEQTIKSKHHVWLAEPLSAVQIAARTLGMRGVLMARSDTVRIPGLGDVNAMLTGCGVAVQEVGAANGSAESDWSDALVEAEGKLIVLVSPNGLPTDKQADLRRYLLDSAKRHRANVLELLVDGSVCRKLSQQYGFPLVTERIENGSHVVVLPTHFLLGAARGALCLGDEACIAAMNKAAKIWGAELDGAAIAANILAIQMANLDDELDRGILGGLSLNPEYLKNRCQRLAIQLGGIGPIHSAEVVQHQTALGPSPWERYRLEGAAIRLQVKSDVRNIYQKLRTGSSDFPAVDTVQKSDHLLVDLRFVLPDDDHKIAGSLRAMTG